MRTKFTDSLALKSFGPDAIKNLDAGNCPMCGKNARETCYSEAGRREAGISGMCEYCYDNLFIKD